MVEVRVHGDVNLWDHLPALILKGLIPATWGLLVPGQTQLDQDIPYAGQSDQ